ncbi:MAG: bifunctional DNA primase/polymerase [Rhodomicrobium sp.]
MAYSPISHAANYAGRGFSPIPICRPYAPLNIKGKEPGSFAPKLGHQLRMTGWERFCAKPASLGEMARWLADDPEAGLGLACGYGGLIGLDVDDARAYGPCREVLGHLKPPSKVGKKGCTGFFHDPSGTIESLVFRAKKGPDGKAGGNLVEVLSIGRQTVIPDTMHPETRRPYFWHDNSLTDCKPSDLPVMTPALIAELKTALAPEMEPERVIAPRTEVRKVDLSELERRRYAGFAWKALDAETSRLATQPKPGRNHELFRATCNLGKWAVNGILPSKIITDRLLDACARNRLQADNGVRDVMKTIQAGFNRARNDPLPQLQERQR